MAHFAPNDMARAIAKDLLAFPITHMSGDLSFDEAPFRAHLDWIIERRPGRRVRARRHRRDSSRSPQTRPRR